MLSENTTPGTETKDVVTHGTATSVTISIFAVVLLGHTSHEGDTKRLRWVLHKQWVWVMSEEHGT